MDILLNDHAVVEWVAFLFDDCRHRFCFRAFSSRCYVLCIVASLVQFIL